MKLITTLALLLSFTAAYAQTSGTSGTMGATTSGTSGTIGGATSGTSGTMGNTTSENIWNNGEYNLSYIQFWFRCSN